MTDIKLDILPNLRGDNIAHFMGGDVFLTVRPHVILESDGTLKDRGLEVEFWGKNDSGQRDPNNLINSNIVPGTREDLEEIADTYARRLAGGVKPENMFDDIIDANRKTD